MEKIELDNLISQENLEKFNIDKKQAINKVVDYFRNKSEHGYFFATISIGEPVVDFIENGGNIFNRIIYGDFKTGIAEDFSVDEVCLAYDEFSKISGMKKYGNTSTCFFYDIDDEKYINFMGAFEGEKDGEYFNLSKIYVEDINEVMKVADKVSQNNDNSNDM